MNVFAKNVFSTPINIAYTHKTRKAVNKKWNDKLKPNNSLYIPVIEDDKNTDKICIYNQVVL